MERKEAEQLDNVFTIKQDVWQVFYKGKVLPTTWTSRGAALAHLKRLQVLERAFKALLGDWS